MRERLAAQVAAALILRAGRAVGALRLMKLMYLVEREAMKRHVRPIVFDDIFAMPNGMALSRTYDLMIQEPVRRQMASGHGTSSARLTGSSSATACRATRSTA